MMIMTTIKMKNKTIATAGNILPAMAEDIGEIVFDEMAHFSCPEQLNR